MIHSIRRGAVLAAAAIALVSLAAGCGGGGLYSYPLQNIKQVTYGMSTSVNTMLVRNAFVLGPAPRSTIPRGEDATVYLWLFNRAHRTDRLVGATAQDAARSVQISHGAISIPPNRIVAVGTSSRQVTLRGLTHPIKGGGNVRLTLQFADAGKVSFVVPVLARNGPYATLTPAPTATPTVTTSP